MDPTCLQKKAVNPGTQRVEQVLRMNRYDEVVWQTHPKSPEILTCLRSSSLGGQQFIVPC